MGVSDPSSSTRKETRFEAEGTSSTEHSPESRGRGVTPGETIQSRSSSQGSRFREHDL